jgi:trk system potassium uptake protein TrkH
MAPIVNNQFSRNLQFAFSVSLIVEGLFSLVCSLFALFNGNEIRPFFWPGLLSLLLGSALFYWSDRKISSLKDNSHIFLLITSTYLFIIVLGTFPYLISRTLPRFSDAFFESASGFTATGSSVINNIDQLPQSILLWRSLTHWMGGFYAIVMFLFFFTRLNFNGRSALMPTNNTLLFFNIKDKVVKLATVYLAVTFLQILVLSVEGMSFFKSCCYSFGTAATGCFAPESISLTNYSSVIQYTFMLFMLMAGVGYLPFILPSFSDYFKNKEFKRYVVSIFFSATGLSLIFFLKLGFTGIDSIRMGFFQTLSFLSSTGFTMVDFKDMSDLVLFLFIVLIFVGGCFGSAGGGIKLYRSIAILRHIRSTFSSYQPIVSVKSTSNENGANELSPLAYVFLFFFLTVIGFLVLLLFGITPSRAAFLVISAISTVGHNIDLGGYHAVVKMVLSGLMLLGRLEIYPVLLILFSVFFRAEFHFKSK